MSSNIQAWRQFVDTGSLEGLNVPVEIAESWIRCSRFNVDPCTDNFGEILDEQHLSELLERKKALIDIILPFMQKLYEFVSGTCFTVILADEQGHILEILGDRDVMENAQKINLVKGSKWSEDIGGTNGVGTALQVRKPIQVSGEEHYCKKLHQWTCSAAPIFDNSNKLVGVLQLSGPYKASHLHTLGMAVAAAEAINQQLQIIQQNRELILINNRQYNMFHTMSEGVVLINKNGVIELVNPVAERILETTAEDIEGIQFGSVFSEIPRIKEILASGTPCTDMEININYGGKNIHCLASGKASKDEKGNLNGGVIILNPIKNIRNLVNRFSGAQARFNFEDIIGKSPQTLESIRLASMAAQNDGNVLLQGESGTGKEVFAQAIHNGSARRNGPFIALNCAAIPRDLLGSELFGYVEGAFTGARRGGRPGKFEMASGGTLFLDEIGDMNLGKQSSLLRAIQEKAVIRIGDNRVVPVDVRIICASNKNLQKAAENGEFRRDLFYRLNVLSINLSPLRDHMEDISMLFDYFVKQVSQRQGIAIEYIDPDIIKVLGAYRWPGNVRELENVAERMVCMARGSKLGVKDIPQEILGVDPDDIVDESEVYAAPAALYSKVNISAERNKRKKAMEEQEKKDIIELIARCGGNITVVASEMGVSRNTIYRKMKQYEITES